MTGQAPEQLQTGQHAGTDEDCRWTPGAWQQTAWGQDLGLCAAGGCALGRLALLLLPTPRLGLLLRLAVGRLHRLPAASFSQHACRCATMPEQNVGISCDGSFLTVVKLCNGGQSQTGPALEERERLWPVP